MLRFVVGVAAVFGVAGACVACTTYQDDLARSQHAFEQSDDERALALLRALEPDVPRLSPNERTYYAYLRGMSDYRMGYRAEARHWLSVGSALETQTPGALPADWSKRMRASLEELNEAVYGTGIASLTNNAGSSDPPSGDATPPASPAASDGDAAPPDKPSTPGDSE